MTVNGEGKGQKTGRGRLVFGVIQLFFVGFHRFD